MMSRICSRLPEQFISGEVRYALLTRWRVSPYVLGGIGGGISRPNVNKFFPDKRERHIQTIYYGGGVRIPVAPGSMRSSTHG